MTSVTAVASEATRNVHKQSKIMIFALSESSISLPLWLMRIVDMTILTICFTMITTWFFGFDVFQSNGAGRRNIVTTTNDEVKQRHKVVQRMKFCNISNPVSDQAYQENGKTEPWTRSFIGQYQISSLPEKKKRNGKNEKPMGIVFIRHPQLDQV